jgi:hypothetical protein
MLTTMTSERIAAVVLHVEDEALVRLAARLACTKTLGSGMAREVLQSRAPIPAADRSTVEGYDDAEAPFLEAKS